MFLLKQKPLLLQLVICPLLHLQKHHVLSRSGITCGERTFSTLRTYTCAGGGS